MTMNSRVIFLVLLLCAAAATSVSAAGEYMGGDVVLGGSGPLTIQVTETPAVTQAGIKSVPASPTGSISIATSPKGASIAIDGVDRGISPATIPGISPGSHTLLLKMAGYKDLSVPVTVVQGETRDYALVLTPLAAATAAQAPAKKTPGFEAALGLAALGSVFLLSRRA